MMRVAGGVGCLGLGVFFATLCFCVRTTKRIKNTPLNNPQNRASMPKRKLILIVIFSSLLIAYFGWCICVEFFDANWLSIALKVGIIACGMAIIVVSVKKYKGQKHRE